MYDRARLMASLRTWMFVLHSEFIPAREHVS